MVSTFSKHELAVETTINLVGKAIVGKIKGTVLPRITRVGAARSAGPRREETT